MALLLSCALLVYPIIMSCFRVALVILIIITITIIVTIIIIMINNNHNRSKKKNDNNNDNSMVGIRHPQLRTLGATTVNEVLPLVSKLQPA